MNSSTDKKVDTLIGLMGKLLSREVAPVAPVLPVAPILPIAPLVEHTSDDHDAITKLVVLVAAIDPKLIELKNDIKALSDGTGDRLTKVEARTDVLEKINATQSGKQSIVSTTISVGVSIGITVIGLIIAKHFGF
jgi:hypothetical protein